MVRLIVFMSLLAPCLACNLPVSGDNKEVPISEAINFLPQIESQIMDAMDLHPENLEYQITMVPNLEIVNRMYKEVGGKEPYCYGFYVFKTNEIVVPENIGASTLYHEVGHAISDAYFDETFEDYLPASIPMFIHELIAEAAESVTIDFEKAPK